VPVFPQAAVGHLGLRLPCRGVADSRPDAESWLDADRDAVRRACLDTVDAIPEDLRGLQARQVWAAGKLAVREPRPADAVRARPDPAWVAFLALPASAVLEGRLVQRRAVAALCTPDEALSGA
jgi:hypothetical protein